LPCFFSKRVRERGPAGLWRKHNVAASDKTHWRWTFPIFFAGCAQAFAGGVLGALDQATRGDTILDAGATGNIVDCIKQYDAEDRADPGDGLSQIQGLRIVVLGGLQERECQVFEQCVIIGDERHVNLTGLWHRGIGTAFGHPSTVGCVRALLAALGQGVLTLGMVHMGHQCRALAPQVGAAASEGASRTHGSGRDRGLREQAATEQAGHLWGIALRVFGFATVQSLHREGMPQDTGHALLCTELSQPVPGTHKRDGHDEPLAVWGDGLEQGFRRGLPSALQQAFASRFRIQTDMLRACRSIPQ